MKPLCDIPRRMFAAGSKRHLGDLGATAIVLVLLMKDLPCDGWSMTLGETTDFSLAAVARGRQG